MTNDPKMCTVAFLAIAGSVLGGCSLLPPALRGEPSRPLWVTQGSGIHGGKGGGALFGVGMATSISDVALRREVAEAAARAELARTLRAHVSSTLRSYSASTSRGRFETADRHTDRTMMVVTQASLEGARVVDRFLERRGGGDVEYALVRLDGDGLRRTIASARGLTEDERRGILDRAERAFRRVEEGRAR